MKKTTVIAEIGSNDNGSLENCYRLIDSAAEAGCDVAKFQFFRASALYPRSAGKLDWQNEEGAFAYDIYDAVKNFELPEEWISKIVAYCEKRGIEASSSVFDLSGADYLSNHGFTSLKISSYGLTHIPLLEYAASKKIPLILSTGGGTLSETEEAVKAVLRYHNNLTLLHCSISYPTALSECNLGVLKTLSLAFPDIAVGYSDHTAEVWEAPFAAVLLGARVIEKHITLNRKMEGPDHFFALEPKQLKIMVDKIREAEQLRESGKNRVSQQLYGSTEKKTYPQEEYLRNFAYMSLFANCSIKKGEQIRPENLSILRPGKKQRGLDPKWLKLFTTHSVLASHDISFEDPINWEDIFTPIEQAKR